MNRNVLISLIVLLAGILACNVPQGAAPTPVVITQVVVATQQEQGELGQQIQPSPTLSLPTVSLATATLPPTGTPVDTATIPPTATMRGPAVTFVKNANCRKGPGTGYDVVTSFYEGETVKIVGRSPNLNNTWWYVEIPSGGNCWVSLTTGQAYGDFDSVPTIVP